MKFVYMDIYLSGLNAKKHAIMITSYNTRGNAYGYQ